MTSPVFDQINIVSADFEETRGFYHTLGVKIGDPYCGADGEALHASHRPPEGLKVELDSPRFARLWNQGWADEPDLAGRILLVLRLPDRESVDRLYAETIGKGHKGLQPPCDGFWGARYAIVEDPDGLAVGLMSEAEDRYRSAPPA